MANTVANSRLAQPAHDRHRILVCLDRSPFSEVCVPYAVSLAETFESAITLVYVMQGPQDHSAPHASDALGWEISRQEARGYLEQIEKDVAKASGQPVDVRLEQGRPAERIADLAHELSANLTVFGSRGEGAGPARNLGSTAQQVLAQVRTSVFIVHASSTAPTEPTSTRILVPLDGSLRAESVLPTAARLASAHGGEILLVHVVEEPLPTALLTAAEDIALAQELAGRLVSGANEYLERLRIQLSHEVPSVRKLVVRHANEYQCLLELSQKERTDLIVLSAHGSACDSARSFGSVTTYLLTHSMAPLLVVQDIAERDLRRGPDVDASLGVPSLRASYAPGNP